jgi:hypothetical protein
MMKHRVEIHQRALFAAQGMLPAHRRAAINARRATAMSIGALPLRPQSLQQKAFFIGRHMDGRKKILVARGDDNGSGLRRPQAIAEIAQGRQVAIRATKSPVGMEPDAIGLVDRLAAMRARQHEINFTTLVSGRIDFEEKIAEGGTRPLAIRGNPCR